MMKRSKIKKQMICILMKVKKIKDKILHSNKKEDHLK